MHLKVILQAHSIVPVSATIVKGGEKVYAAVTSGNPLVVLLKNGGTTVETINAGASGGQFYSSSTYSGPITSLVISRTGRAPEFNAIGINGIILKDDSTTNLAFGTNGFYLPMDNQDNFEKDKSGEGNDWTKNNFSGTSIDPDVLKDSPSSAVFGGRAQTGITTTSSAPANYCTLNPFDAFVSTKDGNLETVNSSGWQGIRATLGMKSGKFYWETQNNQTAAAILGIADTQATGFVDGAIFGSTGHGGGDANPAWTWAGANYYFNATSAAAGSLANHTSSDIVQYAFDADNGNLWFGRNGTWYSSSWATTGDPANGVNPTVSGIDTTKTYVACGTFFSGSAKFNFGQKPFKYAPPQGFLPLNSASARPNKVIPRPDQYVGIITATGTAGDRHFKTPGGFGPDLVWAKERNASTNNALFDSVRGATKRIVSNSNQAEDTQATQLKSFTDDGFIYGSDLPNNSGDTGVYWCWKAGGNKNTFNVDDVGYATAAAAGLDSGSNTVIGASVGTKQGFSIIKYTGDAGSDTVSHGLTQPPDLLIVKQLNNAGGESWHVMHSALGATYRGKLDSTAAFGNTDDGFGNVDPTSSVFTVAYNGTNKSGSDYIAYCWHNVPGLQKFGKYTGNSSSDGPFVETGMKPALVAFKKSSASGDAWLVYDATRDTHNPTAKRLFWNTTGSEQESNDYAIDIYSNGFKIRTSDGSWNASGETFIYMAWAEAPASNLFGGQSNAR